VHTFAAWIPAAGPSTGSKLFQLEGIIYILAHAHTSANWISLREPKHKQLQAELFYLEGIIYDLAHAHACFCNLDTSA
jgi:hypothetical protein